MARIYNKRGTRANLNTLAAANGLAAGEIYLITDENRLAMGLSANTYETYALESEAGGGYDDTAIVAALSTETSTRSSADSSLTTAVSTANSTRASADTSIVTAFQSADTSLTTAVSTANSTRASADTSLTTEVSTEISRSTSLTTAVSTANSTRASADTSLTTAISTEISTRGSQATSLTTAATSLTTAVSTEASSRVSFDASLTTAISNEASTRVSVDTSITTLVSTEASTRASADTSLTTAVSGEASTRLSVDTSLTTSISSEASSRISGDTSLTTSISNEASTRSSVDTSLTTAYQSADTSLTSAISSSNSSRISGDTSLTTSISNETSSRISADASLTTAVAAIGGASGYTDLTATAASAPSANITRLEREIFANMNIIKVMSNGFADVTLQNDVYRKNWGAWRKQANTTTDVLAGGMGALTLSGATASAIGVGGASTFFNRQTGVNYASAATAASVCHMRYANNCLFIGNGSIGGFIVKFRFGSNDAATVSSARQFWGISSNYASAATNVEPSTLQNSIGVGHGASDTNLMLYWGGSTAQTPVDLGANFPINTLGTDIYDVIISNPAALANTVYVTVIRYSNTTGLEIYRSNQTLTGTAGTAIPTNSSGVTPFWGYRTNNATALAVRTNLVSIYWEADI